MLGNTNKHHLRSKQVIITIFKLYNLSFEVPWLETTPGMPGKCSYAAMSLALSHAHVIYANIAL